MLRNDGKFVLHDMMSTVVGAFIYLALSLMAMVAIVSFSFFIIQLLQ